MAFWKYFLIRAAVFIPLFILFYYLGVGAIFSAIAAALIAFCVAYLFFRKQRDAAAASINYAFSAEARKERALKRGKYAEAEDSLVEENPGLTIDADQKPSKTKINDGVDQPGRIPKDFLAN